jgi:hypothetical protein
MVPNTWLAAAAGTSASKRGRLSGGCPIGARRKRRHRGEVEVAEKRRQ